MNEEDDLLDSHHLPLSRLDRPAVMEEEAPPPVGGARGGEMTVVPRGDDDSGKVEFVEAEDRMEEDSRLGFADSRDRAGVVVEAIGTRVEERVVDGDDGSVPQGEALGREESGDLAGGGVGAGICKMGPSRMVDAEEESGMVAAVVGVPKAEEGNDVSVGSVVGVVSDPPPAKELEEKTVHVATGSELESANYSSLLGFQVSSPWEKEAVDGGQETDAPLGDGNPMLVGCNEEGRANSRCEAGQEVEVGNVDMFGGKDADVNAGKLKSVTLHDMDQSMGGALGSAPVSEKETVENNPMLVGCNEDGRTSSRCEVELKVEPGNADGFGGKDADVNVRGPKSVVLHDADQSTGGTLGLSPVIEKGTVDDNPMLVGCNKEVMTEFRQQVEFGNVDGFGGMDADANAGEPNTVMLHDMDQSMGGRLGSTPVIVEDRVDDDPMLAGCNEEARIGSQSEAGQEFEVVNVDGFGGKVAGVNTGELKSVMLHDTDRSMRGTFSLAPATDEGTVDDNPMQVGRNDEAMISSCCEDNQEYKAGNVDGFGGKDADTNAGELNSVMLHDMDQSMGGTLGSAPVIEEDTVDDNPMLVGCNNEARKNSQSEVGQEVEVGNVDGFGGKDADVNAGELKSVMLHDMDQSMGGTSSSAPVINEETVDDNPMQEGCNEEAMKSSRCEDRQEYKVSNVDGFGGKNADVNAGELKSAMLRDMDQSLVGSLGSAHAFEEEMVDAYGPQKVNIPIVDDEVMHVDVSPHSIVKEEAAIGEVGAMMIHDVDDSVTITPEEEGGAAALPPISVDEDAMVEFVTVAEEKELSTGMPVRVGGRKKRGRPPRSQASKAQSKKKVEEDVCFICFDGGDLVVCDRRGCPKVYHPSCVNRDEAFFRAKGRWNCGWHICSICEKSARYMCYTCTHSLCRGCVKETDFVCIRGNQGLCGTCRSMVMLIETNEQEHKTVNFDDKSSWEFLFKDYWSDLKAKLSITLDEVAQAKNPSKRPLIQNDQSSDEIYDANDAAASSSDSSSGHHVRSSSAKKKLKRKSKTDRNDETLVNMLDSVGSSMPVDGEWASKELLEFVTHMRGAETTMLSQFDVQELLLEYIKRNNLRDPRRKSQIICDSRLKSLFGKARVGHFEMLKLLESHFLIKETSQASADDYQGTIGDTDGGQTDLDGSNDAARKNSDKRRKARKKEERGLQNNFNDYAAVDVHNINLVYLRRNLMEDLLDDAENFHHKVVGAFVRIRISGSGQKQDMYRIVQVVGSSKAPEIYKTGKKTTDIALEILNLNKTEVIRIDSISNQEFTEEECKRLRQSIRCGLICPMTVGDLQDKAMTLQSVRVNDWLESEKLRLGHLRDRASEKGRRKELRECVEKLQLLNTPEEHTRRLNEIPEIHADPKMDPAYESAEEESDDRKRDNSFRLRDSVSSRKGRELMSSGKNLASVGSWNAGRGSSVAVLEPDRNVRDVYNYTGDRKNELVEAPADASRVVNAWSNSENVAGTGQSAISTSPSVPTGTGLSTASSINDAEKIWHYQDPSGKTQGPFSMVQLRKWNSTGYFPRDLKIWKASENQEDSILLTDALNGKIQELPNTAIGLDKFMSAQSSTVISTGGNWNLAKNFSSAPGLKQADGDPLSAVSHPGKSVYNPSSHGRLQSISGEIGKVQVPNGSLHNSGNNSYNLSTTPKPSAVTGSGVGGHGMDNNLAAGQPMSARWDANSSQHVNAYHSLSTSFQPNSTTTGWVDTSRASSSGWPSNMSSFPAVKTTEQLDHVKQFVSVQSLEQTDGLCRSQKNAAPEHGLNPEVSDQGEMRSNVGANTYHGLVCPSPTPKNEESKSFPMDSEQQRSFTSSVNQNVRADAVMVSTGEMISSKFPDSGDGMRQSQLQRQDLTTSMPHSPSGDRKSSVATNSSEWSMPSPTPSTGSLGPGTSAKVSLVHNPASTQWQTNSSQVVPQTTGDQDARTSQNNTNIGWATVQGNAALGWGALAQGNANLGWINSAQGAANVNMGWGSAGQSNPTTSMVWRVPGQGSTNINAGQGTAVQGNPNPNTGWGIVAPLNAFLSSNWQAPAQGYPNVNPSWVAPTQENAGPNGSWAASANTNTNTNARWGTQAQGNPNGNAGYGSGNGNINAGWNSSASKNSSSRGSHHREDRERHSGHGDRGFQSKPYGHGGGRQRVQPSGGATSRPPEGGPRGVCKFHENGHCRKGSSCNFLHT